MLHVLGSPTDEFSYHLCLYYARKCAETHTGIAVATATNSAAFPTANGTAFAATANGTAAFPTANGTAFAATADGVVNGAADHPEGPILEFRFAVIHPYSENWSFPINLTESSLKAASQVGVDKAVVEIVAWKPDVIHSHLNCHKGHVTYR